MEYIYINISLGNQNQYTYINKKKQIWYRDVKIKILRLSVASVEEDGIWAKEIRISVVQNMYQRLGITYF